MILAYMFDDLIINFKIILFINHNKPSSNNQHQASSTPNPPPNLFTSCPFSTLSTPAKIKYASMPNNLTEHAVPPFKHLNPPSLVNTSSSSSQQQQTTALSARSYFPSKKWALKSDPFPTYFIRLMEKLQLSKECLGKVYREFSRQMYNKFKHQFPKMRESEIVRKIIKDWEALSYQQKEALNDRYTATNSFRDDENGSPYAKKSYQISDTGVKTASPTPIKNYKTKVFPPLFQARPEYDNDSDYNRYSERPSEDQKSDRSSYSVALNRKAQLSVSKKDRYSNFYKYNYSKLAQEHPKWTSREISHIVKLQWKDLQKKSKESSKRKLTKTKIIRRLISGMSWFFVKSRKNGIPLREARKNWKKLPLESKKLYSWRAAGKNPEDRRNKPFVRVYRSRNVLMLK